MCGVRNAAGLQDLGLEAVVRAEGVMSCETICAAETVRYAQKNVRHVKVAQHRVTILQNGEDLGSATEDGKSFQRVTGYRVSISG